MSSISATFIVWRHLETMHHADRKKVLGWDKDRPNSIG
jgi:hypothetical protein